METNELAVEFVNDLVIPVDSVVLERLISEVENEEVVPTIGSYNRTHNRHNR